jgi:hypothetical protein
MFNVAASDLTTVLSKACYGSAYIFRYVFLQIRIAVSELLFKCVMAYSKVRDLAASSEKCM